jgi:ATP/maltotriose-dependent transcriptional regulator MalT
LFDCPLLPRPRLTELINRATRRKVALVCGPAGTGKTVACAHWAAAPSGDRRVVWLTWSAGELATVGAADLAWSVRERCLIGELGHAAVRP